ncbi:MAG: hypothetical protein QOD82_5142, partial [Pseudonocardiales bacterium]|nr:hypothetical protein [Pseudonocardiales bacterium]
MVAVTGTGTARTGAPLAAAARRSWGRWVVLLAAGVYFLVPLYAALRFA